MSPALLLRLEGAALLFCALFFYHSQRFSWILFIALFLWPDILMVGYLLNPKLGSRLYKLVHTDVLPAALAASSFALHRHPRWYLHSSGLAISALTGHSASV